MDNLGSFNNNINNNINNNFTISSAKASIVNTNSAQSANIQNAQNANIQNYTNQNQNNSIMNQNINQLAAFDYSKIKMDNDTILKYLQNLLNLPKTIDELVNKIDAKTLRLNSQNKVFNVLIEDLISTKLLSEFLNTNSKEAINKLFQTISNSIKSGNTNVEQLKEMFNILNSIQNTTSNFNPITANSIKELLLLYIPLNKFVFDRPIETDDDLKEIIKENSDSYSSSKNSKLTILFQTINFSNVLCSINIHNNDILINFYINELFPAIKFSKIFQMFLTKMNINAMMDFKTKIKPNKIFDAQNFKIISDGLIPSNALILAHLVINLIFKFDNDF